VNNFISVVLYVFHLVPFVNQIAEVLDEFIESYGPRQDILLTPPLVAGRRFSLGL
jgi:hypothetical protein